MSPALTKPHVPLGTRISFKKVKITLESIQNCWTTLGRILQGPLNLNPTPCEKGLVTPDQ